jgi:hypothetical protein
MRLSVLSRVHPSIRESTEKFCKRVSCLCPRAAQASKFDTGYCRLFEGELWFFNVPRIVDLLTIRFRQLGAQ